MRFGDDTSPARAVLSRTISIRRRVSRVLVFLGVAAFIANAAAGPLLPPRQWGSLLRMTNGNVRLDYDLNTGRANFYWQNALRVAGFYSGVGLETYITGTVYTNRTWAVTDNVVTVTSTRGDLPTMKQVFILDQDNSFLTRMDVVGTGLRSRWMGPVVMDMAGGVDIGSYGDNRALIVPFDNDSFTFSYNALSINSASGSYEASAFYDNASRNGLVVGSVTHDQWKTGVYFQGSNNRLNVMNVYGGVTSSDTRDVMPHGFVTGDTISSPTAFVGFGPDWRAVMEAYADANAAMVPKLSWNGGVPFGWNSWYAYTTSVNYSNAMAASSFVRTALQPNNFNDRGVVYINLDSYWSNLSDSELRQFASNCHSNGQKAGIYWTPFVYWGTADQGSNALVTGSSQWKWSDAFLRTTNGSVQTVDGGIAVDPTHPGFRQAVDYYLGYFKGRGFDYLKLDFLSHGALEGVHYDPRVTTGIQAYNQGMRYLLQQNDGRMFLSESIAPIFPYQYAHARRIYCDAATSIGDTAATMQAVTYGWWINGRLYQFSDPDMMKFAGGTANENQSRLINCAVAGTVFLNGDDLASSTGQNLARACLTNAAINEVARAGVSFRAVEGNTGTSAADVFVRQDGATWYVAVFNYSGVSANKSLNLSRLGISGTFSVVDLWSGALSTVSGTTWTVSLGARQAKLFRLGSGSTSAAGPADQAACVGGSATFTTVASGTPPFSYVWRKDGMVLGGRNANTITITPLALSDAGLYAVEVTGGSGRVTNQARLTVAPTPLRWAVGDAEWDFTGSGTWHDASGADALYRDGAAVVFDDAATGAAPIVVAVNQWVAPGSVLVSNAAKDYVLTGNGGISGASGALTKRGSGKLTLASDNSYSGPTTISAGNLQVGDGGARGTLGCGYVTNNATLTFARGDHYTLPALGGGYPALLGGPGTLRQVGAGKLIFDYQYVFGRWVGAPVQGLSVGPGSVAETTAYNPVGPVTLEGGTLLSGGGNSASYQSWVLCGGVAVLSNALTSVIASSSRLNAFSQVELRDTTVFDVAAGAANGIDLLVTAVLTHSYWEYGNWGTLRKVGPGTMVLTATNLYQGETIVSGGTLRLQASGSIGASGFPVTVQAGGHFGGNGTVNRNLNVQGGGFLEPGMEPGKPGTLTVNGNVNLAGNTVMDLDRSLSPSNDVLAVTGSLAFGGTLSVTNAGPALVSGDRFRLFSRTGTGVFGSVNLPALDAGLGWTNKLSADGTIEVVRVASPVPANLSVQADSTTLTLTWPPDHTGWRLQVQTNLPGQGLGTNWSDLTGSGLTNRWSIPIDALNGSVFLRLFLP